MDARVDNLTLSVAEILDRPGEYRDLRLARPVEGVATGLARLEPVPVEAVLRAESVMEGILITGSLEGRAALECARCLTPFSSVISVDACELYADPAKAPPDGDEVYVIEGLDIDLEPMLRDALTLTLPLHPLCRADCMGLCARCGRDLNKGSCSCVEADTDPRWAPLGDLRARLGEKTQ